MCEQWVSDLLRGLPAAIISLVVGAIVAWFAYRLAATTKAKFRLDLFEKRHEVFMATWKYLQDLVQKNPVTTTDIFTFSTNTANAKFLFGEEIVQFLEEAQSKGIQLGTAQYTISWPPSDEARSQASAECRELVVWVERELKQVKDRFKPYLDLSSWQ